MITYPPVCCSNVRGFSFFEPYSPECVSKALLILFFSAAVGFRILTLPFLFFFVEKNDLCLSICVVAGCKFVFGNEGRIWLFALMKFTVDITRVLISFSIPTSSMLCISC